MSNYYKVKQSVDEYIKMAEGHSGKDLIDKFRTFLSKGASILELGTGPGTDWKILSKDFEVTGSDFSSEFLNRLKAKEPTAEFLELDASKLSTDRKFDAIYSNKVLHHLSDEELKQSIRRQAAILNTDGIICHSFWLGEGSETFKGMYVNYHTAEELTKLFEYEFEIVLLEDYAEFEEGDSIILIGRKS